ncbi:MAG: hypothetical protein KA712_02080 [Myxococcales bacterium]|nr:hypothetical protein [Myxococcales bacterium]
MRATRSGGAKRAQRARGTARATLVSLGVHGLGLAALWAFTKPWGLPPPPKPPEVAVEVNLVPPATPAPEDAPPTGAEPSRPPTRAPAKPRGGMPRPRPAPADLRGEAPGGATLGPVVDLDTTLSAPTPRTTTPVATPAPGPCLSRAPTPASKTPLQWPDDLVVPSGRLVVDLAVSAQGEVFQVDVRGDVPPEVRRALSASFARWRFLPALRCDQPVPERYSVALNVEQTP